MAKDPGVIFSTPSFLRTSKAVRKVEGMRQMIPPQHRRPVPHGGTVVDIFRAVIVESDIDAPTGEVYQFKYSISEVEKTATGYNGWTVKENGRTGTFDSAVNNTNIGPAYNYIEDMNDGTGLMGNGIIYENMDTDEATFTLRPAATGAYVWVDMVAFTIAGVNYLEPWFQYENAVDGDCDSE